MYRHFMLTALTVAAVGAVVYIGPIAQDPEYHDFVDQLALWGIPNFSNVLSNLAFLAVGLWGVKKCRTEILSDAYKLPYLIFSFGLILTAIGSGWYHLLSSNASLVWDRLPMTLCFMALFSLILRDYVHEKMGQMILVPALFFGAGSILYWYVSEQMGAGDLRPYVLVQFLPLLLIPFVMVLYAPRHGSRFSLVLALFFYVAAKGAEYLDGEIYQALDRSISGHSIKHLLAAAGSFYALKVFLRSRSSPGMRA